MRDLHVCVFLCDKPLLRFLQEAVRTGDAGSAGVGSEQGPVDSAISGEPEKTTHSTEPLRSRGRSGGRSSTPVRALRSSTPVGGRRHTPRKPRLDHGQDAIVPSVLRITRVVTLWDRDWGSQKTYDEIIAHSTEDGPNHRVYK